MRHLKPFNEDLNKLDNDKKLFDDIIPPLYDVIDNFDIDLRFETECGHRVYMEYDDYISKNEKYDKFIEALPKMGYFFTIDISFKKYNYQKLLEISKIMEIVIKKIEEQGWDFQSFEISGNTDDSFYHQQLTYEFTIPNPRSLSLVKKEFL